MTLARPLQPPLVTPLSSPLRASSGLPWEDGGGSGALWSPMRLTSLRAWYRSDDVVLADAGTTVGTWADKSGVGNHLTDGGVAGRRPAYTTSSAAFGNRPAITFNGTANYLSIAAMSLGGDTALCSIAMLYQQVSYTSGDVVVIYNVGGNNRPVFLQPATANALAWLPAGGATQSVTTTTFASDEVRLVIGTWDGGTGRLYVGSTQEDSDVNAGADFADGGAFAVGATTGGAVPANFRIAELIVQRATMTADERTALHAYARGRYGVP